MGRQPPRSFCFWPPGGRCSPAPPPRQGEVGPGGQRGLYAGCTHGPPSRPLTAKGRVHDGAGGQAGGITSRDTCSEAGPGSPPARGETIASAGEYLTSDNLSLLGSRWPPPSCAPSLPIRPPQPLAQTPEGEGGARWTHHSPAGGSRPRSLSLGENPAVCCRGGRKGLLGRPLFCGAGSLGPPTLEALRFPHSTLGAF